MKFAINLILLFLLCSYITFGEGNPTIEEHSSLKEYAEIAAELNSETSLAYSSTALSLGSKDTEAFVSAFDAVNTSLANLNTIYGQKTVTTNTTPTDKGSSQQQLLLGIQMEKDLALDKEILGFFFMAPATQSAKLSDNPDLLALLNSMRRFSSLRSTYQTLRFRNLLKEQSVTVDYQTEEAKLILDKDLLLLQTQFYLMQKQKLLSDLSDLEKQKHTLSLVVNELSDKIKKKI